MSTTPNAAAAVGDALMLGTAGNPDHTPGRSYNGPTPESFLAALAEHGYTVVPKDATPEPLVTFGDDVNPRYLLEHLRVGLVVEVTTHPNPGNVAVTTCVWEGCDDNGVTLTPLDGDALEVYSDSGERPAHGRIWALLWTQLQQVRIH